jgi:menaquinone-9 beta-reductase
MKRDFDVAVVGAGPAGAACAGWLARAGASVVLLERDRFPRDKPCGDALTPIAIAELHAMGLERELKAHHTTTGLRFRAHGRSVAQPWRRHPDFVDHGKVVRRAVLDELVAGWAATEGAVLSDGTTVTAAKRDGHGWVVHTDGASLSARMLVLADGATSRLSRELGLQRDSAYPLGIAMRGYFESVCHDDAYLEVEMGLDGADGPVAGYGWVFPVGDGTVNLGVGYLSTYRRASEVNLNDLFARYVEDCRDRWGLVSDVPCERPRAGRLPMGASVQPISSPGFAAAGDAGGLNNPFIGEGIGFAYITGRMIADAVGAALLEGDGATPDVAGLQRRYGPFFHLGSLFATAIGWPPVMQGTTWVGMHVPPVMNLVIPVMNHSIARRSIRPVDLIGRAAELGARAVPRYALRVAHRWRRPRSGTGLPRGRRA